MLEPQVQRMPQADSPAITPEQMAGVVAGIVTIVTTVYEILRLVKK